MNAVHIRDLRIAIEHARHTNDREALWSLEHALCNAQLEDAQSSLTSALSEITLLRVAVDALTPFYTHQRTQVEGLTRGMSPEVRRRYFNQFEGVDSALSDLPRAM